MRIYKEEIKGQYSKTPIEYLKESSLTMKEKAMLCVTAWLFSSLVSRSSGSYAFSISP